jgi:ABC-type transport system involved in multi-copper enzyme maturation permease subunit
VKTSARAVRAIAACSVLELYRRRDVYVAAILGAVIIVPLSGVQLFGVEGAVRYMSEITLLLIWVFSIAIALTTAARQIPGEIQRRTILPLLARPVTRGQVVVGKCLGAFLASAGAVILFYVCYALLAGLKSGGLVTGTLVQAVVLHCCFAAVTVSMCLLGSLLLTPSANLTCSALLTAGMLLFGSRLSEMGTAMPAPAKWVVLGLHFILPHFEFFDLRMRLVHGWEGISAVTFTGIVAYGIGYAAVFLAIAAFVFNRKRL